jgi:hypothetical protein
MNERKITGYSIGLIRGNDAENRKMEGFQGGVGYAFQLTLPQSKDFNEDLQALRAQEKAEKRAKAQRHDVSI